MDETPTNSFTPDAVAADLDELRLLAGPMFAAMERSGVPMVVTNPRVPDGPIVFINPAFTTMTGFTEAEALGRNCRFLQGADVDLVVKARIATALRAGEQVEADILNHRKDGSAFWNRLFIRPLLNGQDELAFFLSTQADVTAIRTAGAGIFARNGDPAAEGPDRRLETMLSTSGVAASWEWHLAEKRIVGDARFATIYGLSDAEAARGVPGNVFFSIIHPDDQTRIRLAVGGILRGAEVFSKEYRLSLRDGSLRWVQARGRCRYDDKGQPVLFTGAFVDITEQKRVEERLRVAQSAGGVGTFEYIGGFGTASVSTQFCDLLGLHHALDLPVRTINALVHPSDPPIIDTAPKGDVGIVDQVDFRITRPDDGEIRWLTRRGERLRDLETAGIRFSGVIYDITEAKRVEEALRTLNETLETRVEERTRERDRIWQVSRDLYVLCDGDGVCRNANPAWETDLGYAPGELIGRRLHDLIQSDDQPALDAMIRRLAAGEHVDNLDLRVLAKDGVDRTFSWTCVPEGEAFFAAGRDVTRRIQLEEELRQSQKMEAVGQLTGGIAHDFNNLLTGIVGSLDMVGFRLEKGRVDDVERFVDIAMKSAERAAGLTHRLLAFSRRQSLDARSLDVNALVSSMEELLERTLGEQVSLQIALKPDMEPAFCDSNQLENALLNLAINARDAMPDGGRLSIATGTLSLTKSLPGQELAPGDYVTIAVADTGSGMSAETVAKAFDPFFTTKPIGQGTGLGLSMVYGFTKQSGGHVRIDSKLGAGTTITLFVPRFAGTSEAAAKQGAAKSLPPAEGETVLVVEDDASVRMLVLEILADLGYESIEAADSTAAIPILASDRKIDLMVSDVGLPGMNGRQLADVARQHRPGLKILFVTGYAQNAAVRADFLLDGMDMIAKPFAMKALATKVREMLE